MRRPAPNTIKYTNCTCRILGRRNRHAGTTPSSATVRLLFTLVFTANAHIVIPNVMRRPALNTIKYTNFTCRTVSRRNRYAGTTPSSATSLSATPSFVALSSATVWGLFTLVFTANAHIVIPNVMRRPALNTIKYTNFTCRTVSRRNRYAGTTPSSATLLPATVRSPFTLRRSYRRRHRLVSFSLKSFRLWRCRCLPIRSPRSVTDEYWYVASAARSCAAEWRGSSDILRKLHLIRPLNN